MTTWQIYLPDDAKDVHHCQCYNTLTGEVLSKSAIDPGESNHRTTKIDATSIQFTVSVVTSSDNLKSELNIDSTFEGSGLWGNVSTKSQYAETSFIDTYATYVVAYANVQTEIQTRFWENSPKPTQEMMEYRKADNYDAKRWMEIYGDAYIRSVTMGGEFIAILRYNTRTEKEQSDLKVDLEAAVEAFGVETDINSSFVTSISNVKTSSERKIKLIQLGGRKGLKGINLEDLPTAAQDWTNTVFDHPVPIAVEVHTLDTIFPPSVPKPPRIPRSTYKWAQTINMYQTRYDELVQKTLPVLGTHPWRFHNVGMATRDATALTNLAKKSLDIMNIQKDALEADPFKDKTATQQKQISQLESTLQGMPVLKQGIRYKVALPGQYLTADSVLEDSLVHVKDLDRGNELQIWTDRKSTPNAEHLRPGTRQFQMHVGSEPGDVQLVNWESGLCLVVSQDGFVRMKPVQDVKGIPLPYRDDSAYTICFWHLRGGGTIENGNREGDFEHKNLDVDHGWAGGQVLWWPEHGEQNQIWIRELA